MGNKIRTILDHGVNGILVDVECQITNGLPSIVIVGSASSTIHESKERVRSALLNSGLELPRKRITLNLAPADIPKTGTSLDLPIAIAILQASKQLVISKSRRFIIIGELSLDGTIRPVRGIIGKVLAARGEEDATFIIPAANLGQVASISGLSLIPVSSLRELFNHLTGKEELSISVPPNSTSPSLHQPPAIDIEDIVGQEQAKRAVLVAAAGGHNILLSGPPGTGKSMLARAMISLLPPMSQQEILDVTHIHSLSLANYNELVTIRPLRAPHHTASYSAVIGGGKDLRPGEISLSHHGVLLLDELPEFNRLTLEALRQPLENHDITISRASGSFILPANFILVATANPCPCGFLGSSKPCTCSAAQLARYKTKLSGPLMDRIDLHVTVSNVDHHHLLRRASAGRHTPELQQRVANARQIQAERFPGKALVNARLDNGLLTKIAQLQAEARSLLDTAAQKISLSARGYMRAVKVARTIADLDASEIVLKAHVAEALQYRQR